MTVQS